LEEVRKEAQLKEAREREAKERAAQKEARRRDLEREAKERAAQKEARREARRRDLEREVYDGVLEEIQDGILGKMDSKLKELMREVGKLRARMLKSVKRAPKPKAGELEDNRFGANLPEDIPSAEVFGSEQCSGEVSEEVDVFLRHLLDDLAVAIFSLGSDDVCILDLERFSGTNTLILPAIVSLERAIQPYNEDCTNNLGNRRLDYTYEKFIHLLSGRKRILHGVKSGVGNAGQRDAIQNWVIDNEGVIGNADLFEHLLGGRPDEEDLCSTRNLRWHLARALIAASEECDVGYCNSSLHLAEESRIASGGAGQFTVSSHMLSNEGDLEPVGSEVEVTNLSGKRVFGSMHFDHSKYGKQSGVGYSSRTVRALKILLSF
jgi:hypothetical protein